MKKFSILLCCLLYVVIFTTHAQSGTTGTLTWNISGGKLTISGTGAMPNYYAGGAPWYGSRTSITNIVIGYGVTRIGYWAFDNFTALTSVSIPNSVTSIQRGAFSKCSALPSVTIPNSVKEIVAEAFTHCVNLTTVTIPASVETIGAAFGNCFALAEITNYATSPQVISSSTFIGINKTTCVLKVPATSVSIYRTADVWKGFVNIMAVETPAFR